jgi:hypothetical protein
MEVMQSWNYKSDEVFDLEDELTSVLPLGYKVRIREIKKPATGNVVTQIMLRLYYNTSWGAINLEINLEKKDDSVDRAKVLLQEAIPKLMDTLNKR